MEVTARDNHSPYGKPMERERSGFAGGGELFNIRREVEFQAGVLSENGYNSSFLAFRPAGLFARVLGDQVLRLNDALFRFRGEVAGHVLVLGKAGILPLYGELDRRVEAVRDRLALLMEYANKGFDGQYREVLAEIPALDGREAETGSEASDLDETRVSLEALAERNVASGVLTEFGRKQGYVAFQACPLYGRLVGEVVFTFNDALRRMEDRSSFYLFGGVLRQQDGDEDVDLVIRYYDRLGSAMGLLRGELEEVIACCERQVA